jgi:hypothetical protein
MRKTALVVAGAIAFDLGVLVVASHAATDDLKIGKANAVTTPAPAKTPLPAKAEDDFTPMKVKANVALKTFKFIKFDTVNTSKSCMTSHGTPTTQGGVNGCLVPNEDANSAMQDVSTTR